MTTATSAHKETSTAFLVRVEGALKLAVDTAAWQFEAQSVGRTDRPPVPYDGNGYAWIKVIGPSRRLLWALRRFDALGDGGDGVWSVDIKRHFGGQKLSEQAPPLEAAARVLQRELGDHGRFAVGECLT